MSWIDTHVHIFSTRDTKDKRGPSIGSSDGINDASYYLNAVPSKPLGVVVVDFSKSIDSSHVILAIEELEAAQMPAKGVIKADLDHPKTEQWIHMDAIRAIRIYAKDSVPNISSSHWKSMFDTLRRLKKHVLVFGACEHVPATIAQIPDDILVVIDHLGMPSEAGCGAMLDMAKKRPNLMFKGPGYRTSLNVVNITPWVRRLVDVVGIEHIMLGASDGPFAGPVLETKGPHTGKAYREVVDYPWVVEYITALANSVASTQEEINDLLQNNAKKLYGF